MPIRRGLRLIASVSSARFVAAFLLCALAVLPREASAFEAGAETGSGSGSGTGPAIIVLDGSGSMWGTIGTERASKFDLARGALRKSLSTISPRVSLGLMSFGQRRRADCSDVEVVAPPEAAPPERVLSLVDKLNPKGKGPLALAIQEAGKQIPPGEPGSIIVIHDGIDNCWQDPCASAAALATANPKVGVFLIGFGLDKGDAQRLACVATATHGKVFETGDSASLEAAISEALTLANLERVDPSTGVAVPIPKAATPPVAAGAPGLKLSASLAAGRPPLAVAVLWSIAKADTPTVILKSARSREMSAALDPGSYIVEAHYGLASAKQTVDVAAAGPTVVQVSLGAGVLKIDARADKSGAALTAPLITVFSKSDGKTQPIWIGRDLGADLVLPAGSYAVRIQDGLADQTMDAAIVEGARFNVAPVLGTGRLELSAVIAANGQPLDEVTYAIAEDDPDAPQGRREVVRSADPKASFILPAGTYYITARSGAVETRDRIALGSGAVVQHVANFNIVQLSVSAQGGDAGEIPSSTPGSQASLPVVLRVLSDDGSKREIARATGSAHDFQLPPARYTIEALVSGLNIKAAANVDLTAGRDARVQLKLESAQVSVGGGPSAGAGSWQIKDGGGRTVMHSGLGDSATARLAPGRYVLVTDAGGALAEQAFELKAGDHRDLSVARP